MKYKFRKLQVNTEGDSHSERISVDIKGIPQGAVFNISKLHAFMDRRHGDGTEIADICSTARREPDIPVFDAGVESCSASSCCVSGAGNFKITGDILAHIDNKDVKSSDYEQLRTVLRPGHADLGAYLKYGREGLKPGGGEFSGRMTAAICLAGGIAKQILERRGVKIKAYVLEIGGIPCVMADEEDEKTLLELINLTKESGDSLGGIVGCTISGYPAGIGGPGMDGIDGDLALAMMAIPSAKGVEFGSGFEGSYLNGSVNNDEYFLKEGKIVTRSNNQGGISGGISTGMDISFDVAFKPVPSIEREQRTVDIEKLQETRISVGGRHDVCIVPRVLPVVEAMTALVMLDRLEAENE